MSKKKLTKLEKSTRLIDSLFNESKMKSKMESSSLWARIVLSMSSEQCSICLGLGTTTNHMKGENKPCGCVLRKVFRVVMDRLHAARMRIDHGCTKPRYNGKGFILLEQEFAADVVAVARRAINDVAPQNRAMFSTVYEKHILRGWDWRSCLPSMKEVDKPVTRGDFFHDVYRTQCLLGRTFVELKPYAMFPLNEYFSNKMVHRELIDISRKSVGSKYPYMLGRIDNSVSRDWILDIPRELDPEAVIECGPRVMKLAA